MDAHQKQMTGWLVCVQTWHRISLKSYDVFDFRNRTSLVWGDYYKEGNIWSI